MKSKHPLVDQMLIQLSRVLRMRYLPKMGVPTVIVASVALSILFYNVSFWRDLFKVVTLHSFVDYWFILSIGIILLAFFTMVLTLVGFKYLLKPVLIFLFIVASITAYFMDSYGMPIGNDQIESIFGTDKKEAGAWWTWALLLRFILMGLLPAYILIRLPINYRPIGRQLLTNVATFSVALLTAVVLVLTSTSIAVSVREHRNLRLKMNPGYPVWAFGRYITNASRAYNKPIIPIGVNASQKTSWKQRQKKSVVIFVLGETARRVNFSLNGYTRNTNPELSKLDIINYKDMTACGTATAASLPCMFSHLTKDDIDVEVIRGYENLLDLLARVGINVQWRENNTGCKGLCTRIPTHDFRNATVKEFCTKDECRDEVLLHGLQEQIDKASGDVFIVLHQLGSHGPTYHERYPEKFKVFVPVCENKQIHKCDRQSLINAYDNTILYTDYFLARVVAFLQKNSVNYDTAMLYASDHGESLGENGIYIHGIDKRFAPKEQLQIPMIAWLSQGFAASRKIDLNCVKAASSKPYTHAFLFHTLAGMFDIQATEYSKTHDLFHACVKSN